LLAELLSCKLFPLLVRIELEVCALVFVCDDALCHQLLTLLLLLVALPFFVVLLSLVLSLLVSLSLVSTTLNEGGRDALKWPIIMSLWLGQS
jgi:hypothetical protein